MPPNAINHTRSWQPMARTSSVGLAAGGTSSQDIYDKRRYRRRNRIEIMFGRLKDWRRVATRYDQCPKAFFSAAAFAATVIAWL
jgi:transposase